MGANSGTLGVYRHGSAWVAQYVDADGIKRQKRFADKWSAAQWREAAIEGRAEPARPTLRAALSEASIEQVLRARGETGRRADALRGGARWLRRECADLLDVDLTDSTSLRLSLETVLLRRKNSTPDARIVARGWRLVGTWEQRDGALWRDGVRITLRATSARPIRLAVPPSAAIVPPAKGRRIAPLQRVLERIVAAHPDAVPQSAFPTQLGSVRTLIDLGLLALAPAVSPMREAILALMERDRTVAELGQQAHASLRARGFIEPAQRSEAARATSERVGLIRSVLALVCADVPRIKLERAPQRLTRLATATGNGDPHADAAALQRLDAVLDAHADGDALDRILWLAERFALRQSEARGLRVGDVNLADRLLAVRRNRLEDEQARPLKTRHSERTLEIPTSALERLSVWVQGREGREWLVEGRLKTRDLNARRNLRAREAGFEGRLYASDHRHVRATQALLRGASLTEAARMLGHKNTVQVSKTYGELTQGVVRASLLED